jgi:hypothetical protein
MPPVNGVGEPCAGEPHARFDAAGAGNGAPGHGHAVKRPAGETREKWLRDLTPDNATAPAPDPTSDNVRTRGTVCRGGGSGRAPVRGYLAGR